MIGAKEWIRENPGISKSSSQSGLILIPHIIRLKLKNVWLTWVLIQKEGSWTFLRKEEKKEGSSLIYDIVFLYH